MKTEKEKAQALVDGLERLYGPALREAMRRAMIEIAMTGEITLDPAKEAERIIAESEASK